jgi:Dolichyl-phosphate-mannose-protein mannosyltransferase
VAQAVQQGVAQNQVESSGPSGRQKSKAEQLRLFDPSAWRDAALAWLLQRVVLLALTYLVLQRLLPRSASTPSLSWADWLHVWSNWDGAIYATIAASGYTHLEQAAFFPLFPLLERLLAPLAGGNQALAGVIIANISCLVAFALLRVLAEREYGRTVARRALLYLAIFPLSFFLAAAYTESLFLLLSLATFLALSERRWRLVGVLAALTTLTRPVGILLLVPIIYQSIIAPRLRSRQLRGEAVLMLDAGDGGRPRLPGVDIALAIFLPILVLVGFNLILAPRFGTLTPATTAQAVYWGRRLSWPWDGVMRTLEALRQGLPGSQLLAAALGIFWTLLVAALALASLWRWKSIHPLPPAYALYALATAALVVLTPMHKPGFDWAPLASNGRFLLVVFPFYLLAAVWGVKRPWLHRLVVGVSLPLFLLLAAVSISGPFVA